MKEEINTCKNFDREIGCDLIDCKCEKEEPKQDYTALLKQVGTVQETLEEVAERLARAFDNDNYKALIELVEEGAKWQQEQDKNMYSEEEVLELLHKLMAYNSKNIELENWFKQHKKQIR